MNKISHFRRIERKIMRIKKKQIDSMWVGVCACTTKTKCRKINVIYTMNLFRCEYGCFRWKNKNKNEQKNSNELPIYTYVSWHNFMRLNSDNAIWFVLSIEQFHVLAPPCHALPMLTLFQQKSRTARTYSFSLLFSFCMPKLTVSK